MSHHQTQQNEHTKPRQNRVKLPKQPNVEFDSRGIPSLLIAIKNESLTYPITLKVQESLGKFIEKHSVGFIREAILEKLERIADQPTKARCSECINLTERDGQPFCLWQCATFLPEDQKLLNQVFSCEGFQPKRKAKK